MYRVPSHWAVIVIFALASAAPVSAAEQRFLQRHVPAVVANLQPVNRLAGSKRLNLAIGLPLRNRETLTNLLQQLYDPASPQYHQYLTPEQFTERFGPTEQDYRATMAFARSKGLTVVGTHPNRTLLDVNGSVTDIEKALHVNMRVYRHPSEARTFYAPDGEPTVDAPVQIMAISGLDDFILPRPMNIRTNFFDRALSAAPDVAPYATGSAPRGNYIGKDFRAAYAPGVSLDGSGQSVGLFELDGYYASDVTEYENVAGLPQVALTNVLLNGFGGPPGGNNIEVALDIDMAISMAPGLSQVIVYEGFIENDILNRMATDNLAKQLSSSWTFGPQVDAVREQIFQQFAMQGQSMFQASGDLGAWAGPIFPPSDDPLLTVVGGTSLTKSGSGGAWVSETTWPESGGGISTSYSIPSWQIGINMSTNLGSTTARNIPDVACVADDVIWLIANNGEQGATGGTSASAPLWAGFAALVNQRAAANGKSSIGFINPAIYAIGQGTNYASLLHDITTGNNTTANSTNKFFAVAGYDLCTGWGTPTGSNLINALAAPPDGLMIIPGTNFIASGPTGGPFSPAAQRFSLTNSGTVSLNWMLANTSIWFNVSVGSGTLTPGGPAAHVTLSPSFAAKNLPAGRYVTRLWFTNLNNGFGQSRQFILDVTSPTAPGTTLARLYSFTGGTDGGNPNGLLQGGDGNFYGTAQGGGTNMLGTVFQMTGNGAFTSIYSFIGAGDGAKPRDVLLQGADGNFYGTTFDGGAHSNGIAFKMSANGTLTNLVSFDIPIGDLPYAGLTPGGDGNFYGTTYQGGANGHGTVYTITTNGNLTTLVSFNDVNGGFPHGGLVRGDNGILYGTTYKGGVYGAGTVFAITTNGILTTLYSFTGGGDGGFPYAGLVQSSDGYFYGTTYKGGTNDNGTFFRINAAGMFTNQYSFSGGNDGNHPAAALIQGSDGNLYGTTFDGGIFNEGTLFRMAPDGTPATLVEFDGLKDGANPVAALTQGMDGSLYGTTQNGGAGGQGTIFRLSETFPLQITSQPVSQSVFTGAKVTFNVAVSGRPPYFYQWRAHGTNLTDGGGVSGSATRTLTIRNATAANAGIYSVIVSNTFGSVGSTGAILAVTASPPVINTQPTNQTLMPGQTATFTVTAVGDLPLAYRWQKDGTNLTDGGRISGSATTTLTIDNVIEANNGTYSVMVSNDLDSVGSSEAVLTVIPVSAPGTRMSTLYSFAGGGDGEKPNGLVQGKDGNLYGTTQFGGIYLSGTVFKIATNGVFTTLVSFENNHGSAPVSGLVEDVNGIFYGITQYGGTNRAGNIFSMTPDGIISNLYSFTGDVDGYYPRAGLVRGKDGAFYGCTDAGGSYRKGNVFKVTADGTFTNIYSFGNGSGSGPPSAALASGMDGNFYGIGGGGTFLFGTVFKLTPDGDFTRLHSFTGGPDGGGVASCTLVQGTDGNFYGTNPNSSTNFSGITFSQYGTVFRITTNGVLTTLDEFEYINGANPEAGLTQGADGNFYGTTQTGNGNFNDGTVFRMAPNGTVTTLVEFDGFDDGANPETAMVQGADGNFYGTTSSGGPDGNGTVFRLGVTSAPQITSPPASQTAFAGDTVKLSATVFGAAPLFYQWQRNGVNLTEGGNVLGAAARILTLTNITMASAGTYSMMVSNSLGSALSTGAKLIVIFPRPALQVVTQTNGVFEFTWSALPGQTYQVQYSSNLSSTSWNNFGNAFTATNNAVTASDFIGPDPERFYRVVLLP